MYSAAGRLGNILLGHHQPEQAVTDDSQTSGSAVQAEHQDAVTLPSRQGGVPAMLLPQPGFAARQACAASFPWIESSPDLVASS